MNIKILKTLENIKFPKIIYYDKYWYIYGINSAIDESTKLNKFILECFKYNEKMEFVKKININHFFERSTLIWQIIENNNYFIFLIEQKSVDKIKHSCKFYKYFVKKSNLENFEISKIVNLELENHLISKLYDNYTFSSKIEVDEERPEYYWGKYLFLFLYDKKSYRPKFDKIVDYSGDKGHLLHYIEKNENEYLIIFSIRHKYEERNEYFYNIYSAKSKDLFKFYDTEKIDIENNLSNSDWYCYPDVFRDSTNYYILMNQDDFGKNKKTLLGKITL